MSCRLKHRIICISLLLLFAVKIQAQTDYTLHGFRFIPQSNYSNPSIIPDAYLTVGIPFISSFSNSTFNSSFSFNDLFLEREGSDSLYLNLSAVVQNAEKQTGYFTEVVDQDLIYVGIKAGKGFVNFGIRNRLYVRTFYTKDLLDVLWNGTAHKMGETINLSNTSLSADHFFSYYFSYAFPVSNFVHLGVRVNYNQGLSNISTERSHLKLRTNEDPNSVYSMTASSDFLVHTSQIATTTSNGGISLQDYFLNFENRGFSFDLGANFRFSDRVSLNFSGLDLGYITWKSNTMSYESKEDTIHFDGIYADITNKDVDIFQMYGDSLKELFHVKEYSTVYMTNFPVRLTATLEYYSWDRSNRLSFMFAGRFLKTYFEPSFSFGFDRKVSRHFAYKLSYTYLSYAPLNVGFGLALNARPFQFYFITDNMMSLLNLSGQRYVHFRFGINLLFPKKKHALPFGAL